MYSNNNTFIKKVNQSRSNSVKNKVDSKYKNIKKINYKNKNATNDKRYNSLIKIFNNKFNYTITPDERKSSNKSFSKSANIQNSRRANSNIVSWNVNSRGLNIHVQNNNKNVQCSKNIKCSNRTYNVSGPNISNNINVINVNSKSRKSSPYMNKRISNNITAVNLNSTTPMEKLKVQQKLNKYKQILDRKLEELTRNRTNSNIKQRNNDRIRNRSVSCRARSKLQCSQSKEVRKANATPNKCLNFKSNDRISILYLKKKISPSIRKSTKQSCTQSMLNSTQIKKLSSKEYKTTTLSNNRATFTSMVINSLANNNNFNNTYSLRHPSKNSKLNHVKTITKSNSEMASTNNEINSAFNGHSTIRNQICKKC